MARKEGRGRSREPGIENREQVARAGSRVGRVEQGSEETRERESKDECDGKNKNKFTVI